MSPFETIGFIYIVIAVIAFTFGLGYFAYRGVRQAQREIQAGRERERGMVVEER